MTVTKKLFGGVVVLAFLTSMMGCGDDIECGAGTVERDGTCVPAQTITCGDGTEPVNGACVPVDDLCPTGQVWSGGECVDEVVCADGTELDNGECVPLCGEGEVWNETAGECRDENECGTGTALVNGECVPDDNLCPTGQVWVNGACVDEVGCGEGTILNSTTDECIPIDPMDDVDVMEATEPNDPFVGGDPAVAVLPSTAGQSVILGGVIEEPFDQDGDEETLEPDFDAFAFTGAAGQRLQIEATAVGVPSVAWVLFHMNDAGESDYTRAGIPIGTRNAFRQVVLPLPGTYILYVGDKANILDTFFEYPMGEYDGAADYSYVVAVTPIANPTPTAQASGNFTVSGDLMDIPEWQVNATAGSVLLVGIESANADVDAVYMASNAARSAYYGEFYSWLQLVPTGGLLLTADFVYAMARDTGFSLTSSVVPVENVTVSTTTPDEFTEQVIEAGGIRLYKFVLTGPMAADFWWNGEGDFLPFILDEDMNTVAQYPYGYWYDGGMTVALEAGTYYLLVTEGSAADSSFIPYFDLLCSFSDLTQIGTGIVPVSDQDMDISKLNIDTLSETGDVSFFNFEAGEPGQLTLTGKPDEDLDLQLWLFNGPMLAVDGEFDFYYLGYLTDYVADFDGTGFGGEEEGSWLSFDQGYFVAAQAFAMAATPIGTAFDLTVAIDLEPTGDPDLGYDGIPIIFEEEPNDVPADATEFGLIALDEELLGFAQLLFSENGVVWDYWKLSVANTSELLLWTDYDWYNTYDEPDTLMWLLDEDGNEIAFNDDYYLYYTSLLYEAVPAGTYYVVVDSYWSQYGYEDYDYFLYATVDGEPFCMPGEARCSGNNVLICDEDGEAEVSYACGAACVDGECPVVAETETVAGTNDESADAQALGTLAGGSRKLVEGEILPMTHPDEDVDWYSFTLAGTAMVEAGTYQIGDVEFDTELFLYELNSTGTVVAELDSDDDDGPGYYSLVGPLPLGPGKYGLLVQYSSDYTGRGLGGEYGLFINTASLECLMDTPVTTCSSDVHNYCVDYELLPITCLDDCAGGVCGEVDWPFVGTGTLATADDIDRWGFFFDATGTEPTTLKFDVGPFAGTAPEAFGFLCETDNLPCDADDNLAIGTSFGYSFVGTGEYYLGIASDAGAGKYDVEINPVICFTGDPICTSDGQNISECNSEGTGPTDVVITSCAAGCAAAACIPVPEGAADNNSAVKAQNLGALDGVLPVNGAINPAADEDWFRFTVDQPAVVRFETLPIGGLNDTRIYVHEWTGIGTFTNQLAWDDDSGDGLLSLIEYLYLPATPGTAEEYLVQVKAFSTTYTGAYRLEISPVTMPAVCNPAGSCNGDDFRGCEEDGSAFGGTITCLSDDCTTYGGNDYCGSISEVESNDSADAAQDFGNLTAPGIAAIEADFSSSADQDWFEFTIVGTAVVTIETGLSLSGTPYDDGDTQIWLHESSAPGTPDTGSYIAYNDEGGEGSYSLIGPLELIPGDYWVHVDDYWGETYDYRIDFTALQPTP